MRKMIITGRLGGDPEVKATKGGINYTTFRIASQEYGEDNPSWISVTVWDSGLQNFCKSLKKGGSVIIDGDYTDRIYVSKVSGQPEIGRDIRANSIYFGALPPKDETDQNQSVTETPAIVATSTTVKTKKAKAPVSAPVSAPTTVMPEADDELPF